METPEILAIQQEKEISIVWTEELADRFSDSPAIFAYQKVSSDYAFLDTTVERVQGEEAFHFVLHFAEPIDGVVVIMHPDGVIG